MGEIQLISRNANEGMSERVNFSDAGVMLSTSGGFFDVPLLNRVDPT